MIKHPDRAGSSLSDDADPDSPNKNDPSLLGQGQFGAELSGDTLRQAARLCRSRPSKKLRLTDGRRVTEFREILDRGGPDRIRFMQMSASRLSSARSIRFGRLGAAYRV